MSELHERERTAPEQSPGGQDFSYGRDNTEGSTVGSYGSGNSVPQNCRTGEAYGPGSENTGRGTECVRGETASGASGSDIWVRVADSPFRVNCLGAVQELKNGQWANVTTYIVSKRPGDTGYRAFRRTINGKKTLIYVHALVCTAYHGPRPPNHVVDHINGKKLDNFPENVQWVTASENTRRAIKLGLNKSPPRNLRRCKCGRGIAISDGNPDRKLCARCQMKEDSKKREVVDRTECAMDGCRILMYASKMTERQEQMANLRADGMTVSEIARELGVSRQAVSSVLQILRKRAERGKAFQDATRRLRGG